jgi:hypothetical protein
MNVINESIIIKALRQTEAFIVSYKGMHKYGEDMYRYDK